MKSNFFELNYLWNDPGDTGLYRFGHRGFLEMDASNGPIHCSRIFNPMVQAFRDRIQLNFRVVIGRDYTIRFSDSSGKIVIECKIDAAGWVWINGRKTEIYMTYAYGTPSVDKTFGAVDCTRESDETELRILILSGVPGISHPPNLRKAYRLIFKPRRRISKRSRS